MNTASTLPTPVAAGLPGMVRRLTALFSRFPEPWILLLGRFSIAAVFWKSGQTKIQGLAIDLIGGDIHLGFPHLSDSVVDLFRDEYRLPLLPPDLAAIIAATSEHLFSLLILLGLATRFSALALLVMTLTIEIFVYPDAYPTHGVWATVLLLLLSKGPGKISLDHWLEGRLAASESRIP